LKGGRERVVSVCVCDCDCDRDRDRDHRGVAAVAVVAAARQWHTGEDKEYQELPRSRKRFDLMEMLKMAMLTLFPLSPLPCPSLHLPLHLPLPPSLLRPSKPLLLVVIPLFTLLFPNLNMNITDPRLIHSFLPPHFHA